MEKGLSFPLETYEQTWLQGRAMRASVLRRHMPPWSAVAGYGDFVNDNHLTLRESQFLVSWVEGLGPRNGGRVFLNVVDPNASAIREIRATPHTDHWQLGQPDLLRPLQPIAIEAKATDTTRRVVIDLGLSATVQVRGLEFMPGDRRVVRGATFSLESTDSGSAAGHRGIPSSACLTMSPIVCPRGLASSSTFTTAGRVSLQPIAVRSVSSSRWFRQLERRQISWSKRGPD